LLQEVKSKLDYNVVTWFGFRLETIRCCWPSKLSR